MAESLKVRVRVAIVAALQREVWPLVKRWPRSRREFDGRVFDFFETEQMVAVCGGIGAERARRATEAVIQFYEPGIVISAGFAGGLQADMEIGQTLMPRVVIDVNDGSRIDTGTGTGVLVTFGSVAGVDQKAKLARAFAAQAVDMEAAAVARSAENHGVRFIACKAISDASDFSMPAMASFVDAGGKFQTAKFALHAAVRPWLWPSVVKLARNSSLASRNLCRSLAALADIGTTELAGAQATAAVKP